MKIYKVHYVCDDGHTYQHFFSSRKEANKKYKEIKETMERGENPFTTEVYDVPITKKGFLHYLNLHEGEHL